MVDADIKGSFENISHELMMSKVEHYIADKRLSGLLEAYLKQGIMAEGEAGKPPRGRSKALYSVPCWQIFT